MATARRRRADAHRPIRHGGRAALLCLLVSTALLTASDASDDGQLALIAQATHPDALAELVAHGEELDEAMRIRLVRRLGAVASPGCVPLLEDWWDRFGESLDHHILEALPDHAASMPLLIAAARDWRPGIRARLIERLDTDEAADAIDARAWPELRQTLRSLLTDAEARHHRADAARLLLLVGDPDERATARATLDLPAPPAEPDDLLLAGGLDLEPPPTPATPQASLPDRAARLADVIGYEPTAENEALRALALTRLLMTRWPFPDPASTRARSELAAAHLDDPQLGVRLVALRSALTAGPDRASPSTLDRIRLRPFDELAASAERHAALAAMEAHPTVFAAELTALALSANGELGDRAQRIVTAHPAIFTDFPREHDPGILSRDDPSGWQTTGRHLLTVDGEGARRFVAQACALIADRGFVALGRPPVDRHALVELLIEAGAEWVHAPLCQALVQHTSAREQGLALRAFMRSLSEPAAVDLRPWTRLARSALASDDVSAAMAGLRLMMHPACPANDADRRAWIAERVVGIIDRLDPELELFYRSGQSMIDSDGFFSDLLGFLRDLRADEATPAGALALLAQSEFTSRYRGCAEAAAVLQTTDSARLDAAHAPLVTRLQELLETERRVLRIVACAALQHGSDPALGDVFESAFRRDPLLRVLALEWIAEHAPDRLPALVDMVDRFDLDYVPVARILLAAASPAALELLESRDLPERGLVVAVLADHPSPRLVDWMLGHWSDWLPLAADETYVLRSHREPPFPIAERLWNVGLSAEQRRRLKAAVVAQVGQVE